MTTLRLLHNPRCSKSREALALLQSGGHAVEVIDYQQTPLDLPALQTLLGQLGLGARELLRSGEPEYQALGLERPELGEAELLAALAAHPRLLQRPIVIDGQRALIARPPELLRAWLR
ncbi:arsenate reductase (glutaredoxin) [Paucibacter sp. DJ2R-2]|uniref:arsenate reductase (glutaredoxin) n=1 Tax=Paucibacter sp. DJ2R-2 TaxID=2893558 RepID=UPI0021E3A53C|nr:arsenate reductase (glutaredoxin) [Paucibacter sp. DJ2R-2]MCV2422326.1 arsenate reductase (glutaredoxin) [Paucibacter sp. DJ4R-1]MCV2440522.1 arsenate reductase (glutaredoxin) [Paucibacter sp. DJ2R-2]